MSSDPPRLTRSGRDFALEPSPNPPPTPLLPPQPLPNAQLPTRLRALPHRNSIPPGIAVRVQQKLNPHKKQKLESKKQERQRQLTTPLALIPAPEVSTTTITRFRSQPHRTQSPAPLAYKQKRKPKNPKEPHPQPEEVQPLPRQLPPGTICISTLLSAEDSQKIKELTMPVALRRPSTSQKRRASGHEKENARPKGALMNGLPKPHSPTQINVAARAHNQSLTNGLPGSTHTHPSQTQPPPAQPPSRTEEKDREKALERNIDNVVFGDIMFKAWYPSWYPKEIIGEKALNGDAKTIGIVVQTLYVCKKCFGYGKEVHEWARHCQLCGKGTPGMRVYGHGDGARNVKGAGIWSVWEADGGVDTIFCQNLSLFAKLFLDNKSVFFDVAGFNYFLLVHNPTSQIVGFFSKEKMSWDNNNLACILIFPPWQKKGLGSILMGVSYEISRREEILGGPEKPISDLGKKGYKMFWGREVARWLLECKETDRKKGKGMVTVVDVSRGTWIHGEDCLGVLREMGLVERGGKGRGEVERVVLDKVKVREWVEKMGLNLEKVVDREGFVEGYGYKEVEVEVEEKKAEAAGD